MTQQRKTVLLVEDHPLLRGYLRRSLEQMGFDIQEAADGRTALSQLSSCTPDLVCLDLVLPESSGYEICEFIRGSPRHRNTLVLIMSGHSFPEDRARAVEVGADDFLAKPFSTREFRARIEALLREVEVGAFLSGELVSEVQ